MKFNNIEVRLLIEKRRLRYWEVARAIGIDPCTLSRWMQNELTQERKETVIRAIESIEA